MPLVPGNIPLTEPNPEIERKRRATMPGMAHWSGGGPDGKTCRECVHWTGCGHDPGYYSDRAWAPTLKPRSCAKYRSMMRGDIGPAVPHHMPACRHFETNPEPPPVSK